MDLVVLYYLREELRFLIGDFAQKVHWLLDLLPRIGAASRAVYFKVIDHLLYRLHVRVLQDLVGKHWLKDVVAHVKKVEQLKEVQELRGDAWLSEGEDEVFIDSVLEVVEDVLEVAKFECLELCCLRINQGVEEYKGSDKKEDVEQNFQVDGQRFFEEKADHELVLGLGQIGD